MNPPGWLPAAKVREERARRHAADERATQAEQRVRRLGLRELVLEESEPDRPIVGLRGRH
jgi:hypothetical protein